MLAKKELWQLYSKQCEPIMDGGYPTSLGNPKPDSGKIVGSTVVWLYRRTADGVELLWQKRSKFVDHNQEKWDVSAGGHINYGESVVQAALRELKEEIGAEASPEDLMFVVAEPRRHDNIYYCFTIDWTGREDSFHFDDQEVSEVKWVPFKETAEFRKSYAKPSLIKDDQHFSILENWFKNYGNI